MRIKITRLNFEFVVAAAGLFVIAILMMIPSDFDELTLEQETYCQMVNEGSWPDFKKTFEKSCQNWLTDQN